jgi:hypothetical protein
LAISAAYEHFGAFIFATLRYGLALYYGRTVIADQENSRHWRIDRGGGLLALSGGNVSTLRLLWSR